MIMLLLAYFLILKATFAAGDCPENFYWDGKKCSACSGCPRGSGLKEACTKTQNTECQPCIRGYDYSNSTGMEECIKCDTFSNCLPGRSKKIQECTLFSGPICDGCERDYYHNPVVGCDKCSPRCDGITEDEIKACTTMHDRVCAPKRVRPKTSFFRNVSKDGSQPNSPTKEEGGEIPLVGPEPVASKTTQPREGNLIVANPWFWVPIAIVLLVATVSIGFYKRRARVNRRTRQEGDVNTHNTVVNIALQDQTIPLMPESGVETSSLDEQRVPSRPTDELETNPGEVDLDAPKPSSEELNRQTGLDRPIKGLRITEKRQIMTDLGGRDTGGYFYWQMVAEELGFQDESRGWEGAPNPMENLLKEYGEKEGSTIRGLIEAIRGVGLTHCASQLTQKFDTTSRNNSVSTTPVQNVTIDNTDSVGIPPDPGEENGVTDLVHLLTPGRGEINDRADSVITEPDDTGEGTHTSNITDTAV
ncbi:tumor necrosis factor receptor superfamily member 16-like isoform X1 [Stylophora pistillata]|uniref:tumor necrosis factor receptor superfamily member 16-like isoform X1 n=1 Tax=Stylophora pistillata TaxID=50429 RepID=UPI000C04C4B6|nr:tumor necrosis factor receptor superfamily member 16-like isoform X1 [Stylophora pistillata]